MSKTARLLSLVSLLSHNRVVTMGNIQQVCGIPKRTAYRYINTISEANIPVYFDREAGGYRLTNPVSLPLKQLCANEAAILRSCLRHCQNHVNSEYRQQLQKIDSKLTASHSLLPDEPPSQFCQPKESPRDPDFSFAIGFDLVSVAIANNKGITVFAKQSEDSHSTPLYLTRPGLRFSRAWYVTGVAGGKDVRIDFANIREIRLA